MLGCPNSGGKVVAGRVGIEVFFLRGGIEGQILRLQRSVIRAKWLQFIKMSMGSIVFRLLDEGLYGWQICTWNSIPIADRYCVD